MRRLFVALLVTCGVVAAGPATALARHHHHKRHHSRHHLVKRTEGFGSISASGTTTTPTSPSQTAGTVASFSGGVLTITLNNGNAVSGTVTNETELECQAMDNDGNEDAGMQNDITRDDGPGDNGGEDGGSQTSGSDDNSGDRGDDDGAENGQQCSGAMLTPGAVVDGAELRISGTGAAWAKIELG